MNERRPWDVMVVTDEQIREWYEEIADCGPWGVCCVDEAHKLKNSKSKTLKALEQIPIKFKLLLTATPLVNKLGELWTILRFIYQEKLGKKYDLFENFPVDQPEFVLLLGSVSFVRRVKFCIFVIFWRQLQRQMMHYRRKSGILDLPMKTIITLFIEMLELQEKLYKEAEESERYDSYSTKKKLAAHPKLVNPDLQVAYTCGKCVFFCCCFGMFFVATGKMDVAVKIIHDHVSRGDKVVTLVQWKKLCEMFQDYLENLLEIKTVTYHGDKDDEEREKSLKIFRGDYESFLPCNALIATFDTLGEGANLPEANVIIQYDPPKSFAQNIQSQNR